MHLMQEQMADTRSHISVQSLVVSQTLSWIQEFTRLFQKSFTKHRALQLWESNSLFLYRRCSYRSLLGVTVTLTTATGATSYNTLFYACGIAYLVLLVLVTIFPLPDTDQKAAGKKEGLIDESLKHTHFSVESIAMILIGFTCTGTLQLWLNCAQNFAKENVGWADPSIMQTYYSAGTMLALVVTALLTRKIKDP